MKRGQIYYADLPRGIGSEQKGYRPVLIIQNDVGNKYSPTTIVAVFTTKKTKNKIPTHYWVDNEKCNLPKDSMVMLEQIKTIDKARLGNYVGELTPTDMKNVDKCLKISVGVQ